MWPSSLLFVGFCENRGREGRGMSPMCYSCPYWLRHIPYNYCCASKIDHLFLCFVLFWGFFVHCGLWQVWIFFFFSSISFASLVWISFLNCPLQFVLISHSQLWVLNKKVIWLGQTKHIIKIPFCYAGPSEKDNNKTKQKKNMFFVVLFLVFYLRDNGTRLQALYRGCTCVYLCTCTRSST